MRNGRTVHTKDGLVACILRALLLENLYAITI
jgi:hypothetical protein